MKKISSTVMHTFLSNKYLILFFTLWACSSSAQIKPANYSFETPVTDNYIYNPTGGGWTFAGLSGLVLNGSAVRNENSPEGLQAAYVQSANDSIYQSIYLEPGIYSVSFFAAQRISHNLQDEQIQISIGSTILDTISPAGSKFIKYTTSQFTVKGGMVILQFKGIVSGDNVGFIDNVTINSLSNIKMNDITNPISVFTNSGEHSITLTGISNQPTQSINISATSTNPAIISSSFSIIPNPVPAGQNSVELKFTAGAQTGFADIVVKLEDGTNVIEKNISVRVLDQVVNDFPYFGLPKQSTVNLGDGIDYILIPNVDDGEGNTQNISFSFTNNNPEILEVLSVSYSKGDKVAILKVKSHGIGNASVTLTAKDDGGTANGGVDTYTRDISLSVKIYNYPGLNTAIYDYAFYASMLPDNAVPVPGSLKIVQSANEPFSWVTKGQLWRKMWGYITPTVTGDYLFKTVGPWSSHYFNLSTDADPAKKVQIAFEKDNTLTPSNPIHLIAGNTYYWDAKYTSYDNHAWSIYVGKPNAGYTYLDGSLSSPIFDTVAPLPVKNLRKITTGVNDLYVQWDASKDNAFMGYFVYVNGIKQSDTITVTSYMVKNLDPNTGYSITVRAYDLYENGSLPSNTLTLKTYPVDNNPPTTPTEVKLVTSYDVALQISWSASSDAETEIRGYNVYLEGSSSPINKEIIKDPSYLITNLAIKTAYKIQVEAVDAGYNKSPKSIVASFSTTDFKTTTTVPGFRKGRLQFNMTPVAKSNGIGVLADYKVGSVLMRNKIPNPGFEAEDKTLGYSPSSGLAFTLLPNTNNPSDVYADSKSAKISGGLGDSLNCSFNYKIKGSDKYTLRFAMKKAAASSKGDIRVTVSSLYGVVLFNKVYTPTDNWVLHEDLVLPTAWGNSEGVAFNLTFSFVSGGSVLLDEVQFMMEGDDYMVNGNLSQYSKYGMGLLNEFQPSGLRWGGIGANMDQFSSHVGYHQNDFTYAEWVQMANIVRAKSAFVCGVNEATDWFTDSSTFAKFGDYIAGNATTIYGKKRINQSGIDDLMSTSQGVLLELGNEVWGGEAHGAKTWEANPAAYGKWARSKTSSFKSSAGYQSHKDKMWTAYSGGSTDVSSFSAWTKKVYTGDIGEVDWIAIMGYMGGNLGFSPEIPRGQSELDYHKNTVALLSTYWTQMNAMQKDMIKSIGMIKPYYMYEGNMTRPDYHGKLGQAINFTDYYAGNIERGVVSPMVFELGEGGEWGILEDYTMKKLPLFHSSALFNKYCKGTVLTTKFLSGDSVVDEKGVKVDIEPVSVHTYVNGSDYTILMLSRDFENSYRVQIEIPDSIKNTKGFSMYTITGPGLDATDIKKDSVINTTTSLDSMFVTLAPYSMMVIRFRANSYNLKTPPEGQLVNSKKVTSIDVSSSTGNFHLPDAGQSMVLIPKVNPDDAFINSVSMSILSGNTATGTSVTQNADGNFLLTAGSTPGTITIRFKANDGSGVYKDVVVSVITAVQNTAASYNVQVSPNPSSGIINIELPQEANLSMMRLYTLTGVLITEKLVSPGSQSLDITKQSQGVYILQIIDSEGNITRKRIERM